MSFIAYNEPWSCQVNDQLLSGLNRRRGTNCKLNSRLDPIQQNRSMQIPNSKPTLAMKFLFVPPLPFSRFFSSALGLIIQNRLLFRMRMQSCWNKINSQKCNHLFHRRIVIFTFSPLPVPSPSNNSFQSCPVACNKYVTCCLDLDIPKRDCIPRKKLMRQLLLLLHVLLLPFRDLLRFVSISYTKTDRPSMSTSPPSPHPTPALRIIIALAAVVHKNINSNNNFDPEEDRQSEGGAHLYCSS